MKQSPGTIACLNPTSITVNCGTDGITKGLPSAAQCYWI